MIKEHLPIRLKNLRIEHNLSQADIAEYLKVSRQSISQWENGKTYPDIDNIVLLSKLYKISVDELLGNAVNKTLVQEQTPEIQLLDKASQNILETICLATILVLACQFTILGLLVPIVIAIWQTKTQRCYKIIYLLCIVCFAISSYNLYVMLEHMLSLGAGSFEPV